MIIRATTHRSALVPLRYSLDVSKAPVVGPNAGRADIVITNMTGRTPEELAREFDVFCTVRPTAETRIAHDVVSPALEDWPKLEADRGKALLLDILRERGAMNGPYIAVMHHDTGTRHYSVIYCRVDASGHLLASAWERRSAQEMCKRLEQKYDLVRTGLGPLVRAPTKDELERKRRLEREGKIVPDFKREIRSRIDRATQRADSMSALVEALRDLDVTVRLVPGPDGSIVGISYAWHYEGADIAMSGSSLGQAYTWQGLQLHRGIPYDPDHDSLERLHRSPPALPLGGTDSTTHSATPSSPGELDRGHAAPSPQLAERIATLEALCRAEREFAASRDKRSRLDVTPRENPEPQYRAEGIAVARELDQVYKWGHRVLTHLHGRIQLHAGVLTQDRAAADRLVDRVLADLIESPTSAGEARESGRRQLPESDMRQALQRLRPALREHLLAVMDWTGDETMRPARVAELDRTIREQQLWLRAQPPRDRLAREILPDLAALPEVARAKLHEDYPLAARTLRYHAKKTIGVDLGLAL